MRYFSWLYPLPVDREAVKRLTWLHPSRLTLRGAYTTSYLRIDSFPLHLRGGVAAVRTIASSKDVSLTPKSPVTPVKAKKGLESA
jgi:hypothetical protein